MTVATYTSDLTDIFLFESTTGVTAYGGGGAGLGTGADFAMEGTLCVDKQITNADKGFMFGAGSAFTIGADDHFYVWILGATPGLCDTRDNHGVHAVIGDDTSNFVKFHVNGSDTLPFGGGLPYAIRFDNTALSNFRTLVGTPGTSPDSIGGGLNTTATVKGANLGVDAARIGTGYDILNGTGADPEADFAGILADDVSTSEGIFQPLGAGFGLQGKIRIGSASTACEFLDSNTTINVLDSIHSLTDFTEILVEHASSILTLSNVSFVALGTNNIGRFEALTSAATIALTSCVFLDFGVTVLGTGSTLDNCTWVNSGIITCNGGSLNGGNVSGFEGTANTSPVIWDTNTDPDGSLDDMTFVKGTADTHAIEFGTSIPTTNITIRGCDFTGYSATQDVNSSIFHFLDTTGTITLNLIGCTSDVAFATSYRTEGVVVTVVEDPVTATFTILDNDLAPLSGARVLVEASDGTGDLLFEAATTTLVQAAGTATCTTSAVHGLTTGDEVVIRGAGIAGYNLTASVTVSSTTVFTYAVDSGLGSPATGTPVVTGLVVDGTTNGSGQIADTRTWGGAQPIQGRARASSGSPFFKSGAITGTISSTLGLDSTTVMVIDE